MTDFDNIKTWYFDCDGVLLDYNKVKTKAFYELLLPYGKENANKFINYHKENGGLSRFVKLKYFFKEILKAKVKKNEIEKNLFNFSKMVSDKLKECSNTKGLESFLKKIPSNARKVVVSGGYQDELIDVLKYKNLDIYFDAIFGSPKTKVEILQLEKSNNFLNYPSVFVGDSKIDYVVSKKFNLRFIFLSDYTEFDGWEDYFQNKDVKIINNFINFGNLR